MSKNDCESFTSQDMSKILLFYGAIISIIGPTLQTDYCAICANKSHTMCKYKRGPSNKCIGYSSNKMTPENQNLIVGLHNDIRNNVASGREVGKNFWPLPPGANLHSLKWDQELAAIAQRWADQCISVSKRNQHDKCKNTDRFAVGQNVIQTIRIRSVIDFKNIVAGMVKHWYKEVEKVDPANIAQFAGSTNPDNHIGNFAQLVWAETKYIGCAHSSFTYGFGVLDRLVCNYGPSGNIVGNPIYKAGFPSSKCGYSSKKYPALCSLTDNLKKVRKKRQNIKLKPIFPETKTESSLNNSNIYKTDEADFKLNHHLTQKLFQLFEKLNLTINTNLLMQLNDIHNKYNISSEVQDISKHVEEPEDVAYFDELEFQEHINKTFEWEVAENKSVPVKKQKRKNIGKRINLVTSTESTRGTTNRTLDLLKLLYRMQENPKTTTSCPTYKAVSLMYRGNKCFCYYKYFIPQK